MKKLLLSLCSLGLVFGANAQVISLTSQTQVISENFDALSNSGTDLTTLPNGWWILESTGNTAYRAGNGSANTGDTYSFGTGTETDRALGSIASNTLQSTFGLKIVNKSTTTITEFSYDLFMEQWRNGGRTSSPTVPTHDSLYFSYSINNGISGAWTRVTSNDLISKKTSTSAGTLDGNLADNRQYYTFKITGLIWNIDDTLFIRWSDVNVGGNDDGLAIDNFNFTISGVLPVKYNSFTIALTPDGNLLKWSTASEVNNHVFEVERSINNGAFQKTGTVKGSGTSNSIKHYTFTDSDKSSGTVCYRLNQIDFDGQTERSKTVCVTTQSLNEARIITTPNPFNNRLTIAYTSSQAESLVTIEVIDLLGKVHYASAEKLVEGNNTITANTEALPAGIYFIRIGNGDSVTTQRIIKK